MLQFTISSLSYKLSARVSQSSPIYWNVRLVLVNINVVVQQDHDRLLWGRCEWEAYRSYPRRSLLMSCGYIPHCIAVMAASRGWLICPRKCKRQMCHFICSQEHLIEWWADDSYSLHSESPYQPEAAFRKVLILKTSDRTDWRHHGHHQTELGCKIKEKKHSEAQVKRVAPLPSFQ